MKEFIVLTAILALSTGAVIERSDRGLSGRIIGGEDAAIEDVPYQLALLVGDRQNCGGSIISANWVLTAAHCVVSYSASSLSVRVGTIYWNNGGSVHQVAEKIVHPEYNKDIWSDYDYALLRVETPFALGSPGVKAIELATEDAIGGAMAIVSGWGLDSRVVRLQKVNVPVVSREECREIYGQRDISDRMMCAGWPEGGRNTCNGDSGGPLVVAGRQVGIVSWARGCANPGYPTVFGDVANQREWIRQKTGV